MIHMVLVDAELELVPGEASLTIYDQYFHPEAARKLGARRGRPDIAHAFLSMCQSSIANRQRRIKVWVHTRNDLVIEVAPDAKVPPNYLAFLELMGKVFSGKKEQGFSSHEEKLSDLMKRIAPREIVALTPEGADQDLNGLFQKAEIAIFIGGFPLGDFLSPVYELATHRVSLGTELLTVWTVTCEVLASIPR